MTIPLDTLITGSWDRTLRLWDSRSPTPQQSSHSTPERIYQIDHVNNTLVVAMASRLFHIYDIRRMDVPTLTRESSLKYMTRSLACMPTGEGKKITFKRSFDLSYMQATPLLRLRGGSLWSISTLHLRLRIRNTRLNAIDKRLMTSTTFGLSMLLHSTQRTRICHSPITETNFYDVHDSYNTFSSGGSDGTVSIWDHKVKKRLRQYPKLNNAVSSLAFNCDGTKLAISLSYTWDDGEAGLKTAERPLVVVRKLGDEVKVRVKCRV